MFRLSADRAFAMVILSVFVATAQESAPNPSFEYADVHVSPPLKSTPSTRISQMEGGFLLNDRYRVNRATLIDLIGLAWNVDANRIYGGPGWVELDRFDVDAKTKPATKPETLRPMLQTLLAERFGLKVKTEMRAVPGQVLTRADAPLQLKPAADDNVIPSCRMLPPWFEGGARYVGYECRNVTMDFFANSIRGIVAPTLGVLEPLRNDTGIAGPLDIDIGYAPQPGPNRGPFLAVLKKLGLDVVPGTVQAPALTIESANERPSANPPGTTQNLPAIASPKFEVASIRFCNGECQRTSMRPVLEPAGRFTAEGMPLLSLIQQAWNLPYWVEPIGVPDWFRGREGNVLIEARAPAGYPADFYLGDAIYAMVRALLIERFHLQIHYEDRPVDTYTLVAANPKLTKANPENRSGCKREYREDSGLQRATCQNVTLAQFAEQIPYLDSGYNYPVVDGTSIEGSWDFMIDYRYGTNVSFGQGSPPADGHASDPPLGYSFAGAIEKKLGLKLKAEKKPQPVLVIDHIDRQPTDN